MPAVTDIDGSTYFREDDPVVTPQDDYLRQPLIVAGRLSDDRRDALEFQRRQLNEEYGAAYKKTVAIGVPFKKKLMCRVITEAGAEFIVEATELSVNWRSASGLNSSFQLQGKLISPVEPPCPTVPEEVRRIEVPEPLVLSERAGVYHE